jgi:hypothetical protein
MEDGSIPLLSGETADDGGGSSGGGGGGEFAGEHSPARDHDAHATASSASLASSGSSWLLTNACRGLRSYLDRLSSAVGMHNEPDSRPRSRSNAGCHTCAG